MTLQEIRNYHWAPVCNLSAIVRFLLAYDIRMSFVNAPIQPFISYLMAAFKANIEGVLDYLVSSKLFINLDEDLSEEKIKVEQIIANLRENTSLDPRTRDWLKLQEIIWSKFKQILESKLKTTETITPSI